MFYKNNKAIPFSKIANAAMASNMSVDQYLELSDITEVSDDDVVAVDKDGYNVGGKGNFNISSKGQSSFDFTKKRAFTPDQIEKQKLEEENRIKDPFYLDENIAFNDLLDRKLLFDSTFKEKVLGNNLDFQSQMLKNQMNPAGNFLKAAKPLYEEFMAKEYNTKLNLSDFENIVKDKFFAELEYEVGIKKSSRAIKELKDMGIGNIIKRDVRLKAIDTWFNGVVDRDAGTFLDKIDRDIASKMKEYRFFFNEFEGSEEERKIAIDNVVKDIQELKSQKPEENRSYIFDLKKGQVTTSRQPVSEDEENYKYILPVNTKLQELSADPSMSVIENIKIGYQKASLALTELNDELDQKRTFRVKKSAVFQSDVTKDEEVEMTLRQMLSFRDLGFTDVRILGGPGNNVVTHNFNDFKNLLNKAAEDLPTYHTDLEVYKRLYHLNEGPEGLSRKGLSDFFKYVNESFHGYSSKKEKLKAGADPKRIDVIRAYGRTLGEAGVKPTPEELEYLDNQWSDTFAELGGSARFLVEIWGAGKFLKLAKYGVKAVPMFNQWVNTLKQSKSFYDNATAVMATRVTAKEGAKFFLAEGRTFGDYDPKTFIKGAAFGLGGFGTSKVFQGLSMGRKNVATLTNYIVATPLVFNVSAELSELVGAAIGEIKGTSTIENYIKEAYGDLSNVTQRLISNGIFAYALGLPKVGKAMFDAKQLEKLSVADTELRNYIKDVALKDAKLSEKEYNDLNKKGFHTDLYPTLQSILKGKKLQNFQRKYEALLDIDARQNALRDINPFMTGDVEGALEVVTKQNKGTIAAFKKAGMDLKVEVINEAEAKNRPDYKKTDKGYYTTVKDGKATITYIMEKYNFELAMHEQSHALSDIYFGKDIKFNSIFFGKLKNILGSLETTEVKDGKFITFKEAFENKFGKGESVRNHAEAFAYTAEFLSNPVNYIKVKKANGFYSLKGLLQDTFRTLGMEKDRKLNFALEKDIVVWFGKYIETVNKGASPKQLENLFGDLKTLIQKPKDIQFNEAITEVQVQNFKSEIINSAELSKELQDIYDKSENKFTDIMSLVKPSKNYPVAGDKLGPLIDVAITNYNSNPNIPKELKIDTRRSSTGGDRYDLVTEILYDLGGKNRGFSSIINSYTPFNKKTGKPQKFSSWAIEVMKERMQEYKARAIDKKSETAVMASEGYQRITDTEVSDKIIETTAAPMKKTPLTSVPFESKPSGIENKSTNFEINGEKRTLNQETVVEVENAYKEIFINDNNPTLFSNVSRKLRTSTSKFINDQLGITESMDSKTAIAIAEKNFRAQAKELYEGMPDYSSLEFYDNSQIGKSYLKKYFRQLTEKYKTSEMSVEQAAETNARAYKYEKLPFNETDFIAEVLKGRSPKEKLKRIKTLYQFFHDVTGGQIARDVLNPETKVGKEFRSEVMKREESTFKKLKDGTEIEILGNYINPKLVSKYEAATTKLALARFKGPTPRTLKSEQLMVDEIRNLDVNAPDYRKQMVAVLSRGLGFEEAERFVNEQMPSISGEVTNIFRKHKEALVKLNKLSDKKVPLVQAQSKGPNKGFYTFTDIITKENPDLIGLNINEPIVNRRQSKSFMKSYREEFIVPFLNEISETLIGTSSTKTSGLLVKSLTFDGKEKVVDIDGIIKRVTSTMRDRDIKGAKGKKLKGKELLEFTKNTQASHVVDNSDFKIKVENLLKRKYKNLQNNPDKIPAYLNEVRKLLTKKGINPETKKPYTYEETLQANEYLKEYFYTKLYDFYVNSKDKVQTLNHITFMLQNQTSIGHGISRALATFQSAPISLGKGAIGRTGKREFLYGEHLAQVVNYNGNFALNMTRNSNDKAAFLENFRALSKEFKQGLITKELQLIVDSPENGGRLGMVGEMREDITIGSEINFIRDQATMSTQYDLLTGKSFANKMNDVILAGNVVKKLNKQFKTGFETENMTTQELVNMSFTIDAAIANSRKYNQPTRSSSTFDFDETLIIGGKNFVTATKGGETIKISSAEWPVKGPELTAQGWKMDFKDFVNVRGGVEGPLMQKLRNQLKKYGPDNIFVLTARQQQAAPAIHGWLKSKGVNIPIENITGLGNSTGEAKALWMLDKFAQGYNDMYFVDDAMSNVKAVRNVLEQLDIKYNVQQARVLKSEQLTKDMDVILTETTGLFGKISPAKAKLLGQSVYTKSYIVPSAQDFVGLLQNFQGFGKVGERHKAFFDDNLHKPYSRAYNELNAAQQAITSDYKALGTLLPTVKKKLNKKIPGEPFTYDQAIRVHRWTEAGFEVPGLSEADVKLLTDVVKNDRNLLSFSQNLAKITKQKAGYIEPTEAWTSQSIVSDLNSLVQKVNRDAYFAEFRQNRELVFGKWENGKLVGENMNKIEATQGPAFKEALEDILWRMETGTNRPAGQNKAVNMHMNFINGSVGATMFLNTRSATLQTLSTLNYINWSDNNPLAAAKAFGNQKQYWSDFLFIFNSDLLKQRRAGLKYNVQEAELAQLASGGDGTGVARKIFANLIKVGFTPTQIADSFAISAGGATFYRNRIKTYIKQGLNGKEAKQKAFLDFQEKTEVAQQSSRPDLISPIQAGPMGRMIFAWGNTPMQYARIQEKAIRDLINNRGDKKEHLSKLLYYGFIQSVAFTAAQNAMFAFSLDEDASFDKDEKSRRLDRMVNNMVDSQLRGIGIPGAIASTVKNTVMEYREQSERGFRADHTQTMTQLLSYSPVLGSKFRKIFGYTGVAGGQLKGKTNYEAAMLMGFNLNNPRTLAYANLVEATTNVPMGRTVNKLRNLQIAADANYQWWQRAAAFGGWGSWELGIENEGFEDAVRKIKAIRKAQSSSGKNTKKTKKTFKK